MTKSEAINILQRVWGDFAGALTYADFQRIMPVKQLRETPMQTLQRIAEDDWNVVEHGGVFSETNKQYFKHLGDEPCDHSTTEPSSESSEPEKTISTIWGEVELLSDEPDAAAG